MKVQRSTTHLKGLYEPIQRVLHMTVSTELLESIEGTIFFVSKVTPPEDASKDDWTIELCHIKPTDTELAMMDARAKVKG